MTSKTVSLTEEVYNLLKKMKLPNESFGDTIARLCKNFTAENLIRWFDTTEGWEEMTEKEAEEFDNALKKFRENYKPFKSD
jgi:predicted CopG family antitoxin